MKDNFDLPAQIRFKYIWPWPLSRTSYPSANFFFWNLHTYDIIVQNMEEEFALRSVDRFVVYAT